MDYGEPYAVMREEGLIPTRRELNMTSRPSIDDIVYLEVGQRKFPTPRKIYCRVDKVCNKSIVVTDLVGVLIDNKIKFFLDVNNSISRDFGNRYQFASRKNLYICDGENFDFL